MIKDVLILPSYTDIFQPSWYFKKGCPRETLNIWCPGRGSPTHSTMSTWLKSCENYFYSNPSSSDPIRSQFCTCHGTLAIGACAKLLPDQIDNFLVRGTSIFTRFRLWPHKLFVKQAHCDVYWEYRHIEVHEYMYGYIHGHRHLTIYLCSSYPSKDYLQNFVFTY